MTMAVGPYEYIRLHGAEIPIFRIILKDADTDWPSFCGWCAFRLIVASYRQLTTASIVANFKLLSC